MVIFSYFCYHVILMPSSSNTDLRGLIPIGAATQPVLPAGPVSDLTDSQVQGSAQTKVLLVTAADRGSENDPNVAALFAAEANKLSHQGSTESRPRLPIPGGANFYDVDWQHFFNNRNMGCAYHAAPNYAEFPMNTNGTYDLVEFGKRTRITVDYKNHLIKKKLIDKNQKPNIDAIISNFSDASSWLPDSIAALGDVTRLSSEDREQVSNALIKEANRLLETSNIPRLFELIEHLFPLFVNTFEILESSLPEILHGEHILNAPHCLAPSQDHNYFSHFQYSYDDANAQKFADQMRKYPWAVYYFRRIKEGDCIRLKQTIQTTTIAGSNESSTKIS